MTTCEKCGRVPPSDCVVWTSDGPYCGTCALEAVPDHKIRFHLECECGWHGEHDNTIAKVTEYVWAYGNHVPVKNYSCPKCGKMLEEG
jgi:hypothetical protein